MRFPSLAQWLLLTTLTAVFVGCDDRPSQDPPDEPPKPPIRPRATGDASLAELLGLDAGDIVPNVPADPAAPPGDLKSEADAFTTLEACVESRAAFDPVVGDAVDALGYTTLKRDACRVLEAVKTKSPQPCEAILSSSLKQHCASTVAVTLGDPMLCPLVGPNHDALCTAFARRDDRLCDTTEREDRMVCRAVLSRDPKVCGDDDRCRRRVQRWKSLLPERVDRPELGSKAHAEVAERIEGGTLPTERIELLRTVNGATMRLGPAGSHLVIGEGDPKTWPPPAIVSTPRFHLRMLTSKEVIRQGRHTIPAEAVEIELLVPRRIKLSSETLEGPVLLDVDLLGTNLSDPVRFTLEADMGPSHRKFRVKLVINTFVRDVVKVGPDAAVMH